MTFIKLRLNLQNISNAKLGIWDSVFWGLFLFFFFFLMEKTHSLSTHKIFKMEIQFHTAFVTVICKYIAGFYLKILPPVVSTAHYIKERNTLISLNAAPSWSMACIMHTHTLAIKSLNTISKLGSEAVWSRWAMRNWSTLL